MGMRRGMAHWDPEPEGVVLRDITLGRLLDERAAATPDAEAVVYPGMLRWTWADLARRASRIARGLVELGIGQGEHVAIWAPNLPEWVTLQWAAAKAGIVVVTVNPLYKTAELEYVLGQSGSVAVFYIPELRGISLVETLEQARANLPKLRHAVLFDEVEGLMADGPVDRSPEPHDACMIQYTSGTTGFPKGAMMTHYGIINNCIAVSARWGESAADRIAHGMPYFHAGGCIMQTVLTAVVGNTQVPVVAFDPGQVLGNIESERCTIFVGVPTMIQALLEHPDRPKRDLGSLRLIGTGGSPVPIELVRRAQDVLGADIGIVFGQTEASPVMTQTRLDDTPERKSATVGYAVPHLELKVIEPETGETAKPGEMGEICGRGYSIMRGYYDKPAETEAAIDGEGWLHTGDLAVMDEHGYVNIVGRIKDMVIRGGENIYPAEIENVLLGHPSVADAQIIGVPDPKYGEELCAVVRVTDGATATEDEIRDWVRDRMARYKVPRYVAFVDAYPLTPSGKVQKFKLREQLIPTLGLEDAARIETA